MHTLRRHTITLLTAAAFVAVGAPIAHAQPKDPGSRSAGGQACQAQGAGTMQDGERIARHYANGESSTSTCTDGERCDTWSTYQDDGSLAWFSECYMVPATAAVAKTAVATTPAVSKAR